MIQLIFNNVTFGFMWPKYCKYVSGCFVTHIVILNEEIFSRFCGCSCCSPLKLSDNEFCIFGKHINSTAARSKAWVCGRSPAEIVCLNPTGGMDVCLLWAFCVCCQVEVSATSWSLVQRIPNYCGASLCNLENSWMRRPWLTGGCRAKNKKT